MGGVKFLTGEFFWLPPWVKTLVLLKLFWCPDFERLAVDLEPPMGSFLDGDTGPVLLAGFAKRNGYFFDLRKGRIQNFGLVKIQLSVPKAAGDECVKFGKGGLAWRILSWVSVTLDAREHVFNILLVYYGLVGEGVENPDGQDFVVGGRSFLDCLFGPRGITAGQMLEKSANFGGEGVVNRRDSFDHFLPENWKIGLVWIVEVGLELVPIWDTIKRQFVACLLKRLAEVSMVDRGMILDGSYVSVKAKFGRGLERFFEPRVLKITLFHFQE